MSSSPRRFRPRIRSSPISIRRFRLRRSPLLPLALVLMALVLSGCSDFVVVHPTPTPEPVPSLPPIGFNHRYGNNPVAAADGLAFERSLYSSFVFWEVGLRADPQLAGFVDRTDHNAVVQARAKTTTILVSIATERLITIQGMLALPGDDAQKQYCIGIIDHFRSVGYTNITKASVLVFFTEQDEHAGLGDVGVADRTEMVDDADAVLLLRIVSREGEHALDVDQALGGDAHQDRGGLGARLHHRVVVGPVDEPGQLRVRAKAHLPEHERRVQRALECETVARGHRAVALPR